MNEEYKFNKEWLDLLLKNKDNENASFMLSDNDTRILLTYIEILQNRIDKAIEYIKIYRSYEKIDGKDYLKNREEIGSLSLLQVDDLLDILKESGE